ncbi:imelysin family protein [Pelagimonas sp. KU-00592-HH]|uniref:imelysin family protein n=1 Tax=Pelagimonas sp. KU-00592-HH TaxID=3127651 RepID=UPI00310B7679
MNRLLAVVALVLMMFAGVSASALEKTDLVARVVDDHVLPRMAELAETAVALNDVAEGACAGDSDALRTAWGAAFDAWIAVSHLRFGPSEVDNRAFALAFWPDTRGKTPKALMQLIGKSDPVVRDAEGFAEVSIAAQGYYALEFLLFDPKVSMAGDAEYRCDLVQAIARNIALNATAIHADWQAYADVLKVPGNDIYRSEDEAVQEVFKALGTGLQFTADTRLGRPLGTFERPRPRRAEAWRSQRSLRHVLVASESLAELADILSEGGTEGLQQRLRDGFAYVQEHGAGLDDPAFQGVSDPVGRLKVEILKLSLDDMREIAALELSVHLGVTAGFNALDGD